MRQTQNLLRQKRTWRLIFFVVIVIALAELQKDILIQLLETNAISAEFVVTIEAVVFILLGVVSFRFYKKYLSKSSYVKDVLSDREYEVFQCIVNGKSNQEIIDSLYIEKSTLKTHINHIYKKLSVKDRESLKVLYTDI